MSIDPFENTSTPALSFKGAAVGTTYTGTVTKGAELVPARNYETGELAYWPDGRQKMTAVLGLRMDDGEERSLWANQPSAMFAAITAARAKLGRTIRPGDRLAVEFTGEKPNEKNPKLNPIKQYRVTVTPGEADPFADQAASTPTAPAGPPPWAAPLAAQQPAQPQQTSQPAQAAQYDPAALAQMLDQLPPELRAQVTGDQQ